MIEEPPLLQIRRQSARPGPEVLNRFQQAPIGFLADCMDGRGALDWRIKPVDPERATFVGSALPCLCGPGDNLALLAALTVTQPGDVLMAAGEGFEGLAICGDRVAGMAQTAGQRQSSSTVWRATRTEFALPAFLCSVAALRNSCNASGPGTVGEPVVVGGVTVLARETSWWRLRWRGMVLKREIEAVLARLRSRVKVASLRWMQRSRTGWGYRG